MANFKVLIADDELEALDIMVKRVLDEGYTVIRACDGAEAWQKIQSESPDIIILDLNMPQKSGLEILQQLRENPPEEKWQPVIMVSACNELDGVMGEFSLKAEHYLTKPCSVADILEAIKLAADLIQQHKSSSEEMRNDKK